MAVSLVDILPQSQKVETSVGEVEVWGVSARAIGGLLLRFVELRKMMTDVEVSAEGVMQMSPALAAAIIAEASHQPEAEDKIQDVLPIGDQVLLLEAILGLTMPQGLGPLVRWVVQQAAMLRAPKPGAAALTTEDPATKSPPPSTS
jgi:hypothetical protein